MPRKKATDVNTTETKEATVVSEAAEPVKKTRTKTVKAEPTETKIVDLKDEAVSEIALLKEQLEQLKAELAQAKAVQPQIVVAAPDNGERVHFLWQAEVADDNIVEFGDGGMYGRIVGKTGSFYVPKNDLSRVLSALNRLFLEKRWLIILSGLTDEEREALGVDYKDGEILDRKAFQKIVELSKDELVEIYPELCESHKEMVAKRFYDAFSNGVTVDRETVVALNNIHPIEAFKEIISRMNEADLGE